MSEPGLNVHFSSRRNNWETPQALFDKFNEEFHFELDVCATAATLGVLKAKVDWRFSSDDAKIKLKRLYPTLLS